MFARYAADHLFEIDELGVRDGANLVVRDDNGNEIFAPSFSIWTTIEECLNPPVIWEKERGLVHDAAVQRARGLRVPRGHRPVECVNVEHEEVLLMPRWLDAKRVTFKYGLGDEFIGVLKTLHLLDLDSTVPVRVRSANGPVEVAPRDVVAAALPDPATIGPRMTGQDLRGRLGHGHRARTASRVRCTCTTWPTTSGRWPSTRASASSWQTALNPVIALELLARGSGAGTECSARRRSTRGPSSNYGEPDRRRRLRPGVGAEGPNSRMTAPTSSDGIRRFRLDDLTRLREICVLTGAAGGDATGRWSTDELLPDLFLEPYLTFAPDWAWGIDLGDGPVGYLVAVPDTRRFVSWWRAKWAPWFAVRYTRPGPPYSPEEELVERGFEPQVLLMPELHEYPAHLHIDLCPQAHRAAAAAVPSSRSSSTRSPRGGERVCI